jgi:TPR repeat/Tetratricopeptide repeat
MSAMVQELAAAERHLESGRLGMAEAVCRQILAAHPRDADALHLIGVIACEAKRYDLAVAFISKAVAIDDRRASFHTSLGRAYRMLGRLGEAVRSCRHALQISSTFADAHYELGSALYQKGDVLGAITHCRCAIDLKPDHANAHDRIGAAHLVLGDFESGWLEHEWRRREPRGFSQPQWRGEPLQGERILLHAEEGFGHTLQWVRYAPLVIARGGRVVLEVQPELHRLLAPLPGPEAVVTRGAPLPEFSWHCPLPSLPFAFRTQLATIPAPVPYLSIALDFPRGWMGRVGNGSPRVGLVWASKQTRKGHQFRSLPHFSLLAPLLEIEKATFFSLQKGLAAAQAPIPSHGLRFIDLSAHLEDFLDTAMAIGQLDVVISCDTAVVHLAGAMGKPVWVLLPYVADWKWLLDREDSPWYPTVRLFRQPTPGAWAPIIERLAVELRRLVAGDRSVLHPQSPSASLAG